MHAFELGTRCAWCSRVQDGDKWVEAAEVNPPRKGGTPLWSDGICPSCFDSLSLPPPGAGGSDAMGSPIEHEAEG